MAVLTHYQFHNGKTGKVSRVTGWSYLAAGLLGSIYVLLKAGLKQFPLALFWHLAFLGAIALLPFVVVYLPDNLQVLVLLLGVPGMLVVLSFFMIGCVRQSFRARGWGERLEDD
jgi:FtsH-binding integral membrane protein